VSIAGRPRRLGLIFLRKQGSCLSRLRRHRPWNGSPCRLSTWTAFLFAAIAAMSSCRDCRSGLPDEAPALGRFAVKQSVGTTVRGILVDLDSARISAAAKSVLEGSGIFVSTRESPKQAMVDISLDLEVLADKSEKSEVGVKVRLKIGVHPATSATARYTEDAAAVGQAPLGDTSAGELAAAVERLAERTTQDLLFAYAARQKLWAASEPELAKAMASKASDARVDAIRISGRRKLRGLLPDVLRLLTDDDEGTRDAALGAVVAIGDRSAVRALAESRQMRDTYEMSKLLDAVAALGGQEAKDYLSFVAETHDDQDIRKMAASALERLKRHEANASPTR
jgi:hypothetical protein